MTAAREILLKDMLQKIAAERSCDDPVFEITAIPTTGANFTSQLFHATIKSGTKEDLNLFSKVSIVGETIRHETGISDFYKIEPFFYMDLVTKFTEIEKERNVPQEHRLNIPKFYGGSNEFMKELVVLEDLSKEGFVTYDRLKSVDWEYASKSVEQMAKLHALFMVYQDKYPEHYEEAKNVLKRPMLEETDERDIMVDLLNKSIEQTLKLIKEENRQKFQKFLESDVKLNFKNFFAPHKRSVVVHSDFRPSNLMHKIDEDGNLKVMVVDFQTMHPGSVACDLLYFIFTGSDGEFRAKYYDRLIDHYYEHLAASLKRLGVDPKEAFPRADFDEELKKMLPYALLTAIMIIPLTTIDLEDVTTTAEGVYQMESMDSTTDMLSKVNSLGAKRINDVIDDYVRWGIL